VESFQQNVVCAALSCKENREVLSQLGSICKAPCEWGQNTAIPHSISESVLLTSTSSMYSCSMIQVKHFKHFISSDSQVPVQLILPSVRIYPNSAL
jgi:hypothetical protein